MYGYSTAKRDANEPALVELWERIGCRFIRQGEWGGFDGVLISPFTGVHIVEVKNPEYSWTLTDEEKEFCQWCKENGIPYNVIENDEQALKLATDAT